MDDVDELEANDQVEGDNNSCNGRRVKVELFGWKSNEAKIIPILQQNCSLKTETDRHR